MRLAQQRVEAVVEAGAEAGVGAVVGAARRAVVVLLRAENVPLLVAAAVRWPEEVVLLQGGEQSCLAPEHRTVGVQAARAAVSAHLRRQSGTRTQRMRLLWQRSLLLFSWILCLKTLPVPLHLPCIRPGVM